MPQWKQQRTDFRLANYYGLRMGFAMDIGGFNLSRSAYGVGALAATCTVLSVSRLGDFIANRRMCRQVVGHAFALLSQGKITSLANFRPGFQIKVATDALFDPTAVDEVCRLQITLAMGGFLPLIGR